MEKDGKAPEFLPVSACRLVGPPSDANLLLGYAKPYENSRLQQNAHPFLLLQPMMLI
jgi:hypothetical protein